MSAEQVINIVQLAEYEQNITTMKDLIVVLEEKCSAGDFTIKQSIKFKDNCG